jgi:carbamoyl-phosphate synthase/aspartate carbamoyltransferase
MYINLPSKNHYRRPASYASKGYHSRRMAVDFAVPLITNVKNAKLLAQALVRKLPLDVSNIDAKSSHLTHTFPGLINIGAFVPGLCVPGSQDLITCTAVSLSGGFNTVIVSPVGVNGDIVDRQSLEQARSNVNGHGHCNYAFTVTATAANVGLMDDELQAEVKALFVRTSTPLSVIASHFSAWSSEKVILTDAKGSGLASVLLLASLHGRRVHVTDVRTLEDLLLISLSKAKQLKVTCDISVYSLFFTAEQFPGVHVLPTAEVQKVLWQKLDVIDAFSVGAIPYLLASALGKPASVCSGVGETLPLLLTAVSEQKLTLDDIRRRLYDNPMKIFGFSDQPNTSIEVVIGRRVKYNVHPSCWSPVLQISGATHRVVLQGQTAFLDGSLFSTQNGRDISGMVVANAVPATIKDDHATLPPITSVVTQSSTLQDQYDPASHGLHIQPHPAFHRRHILSVKQFSQKDIYDLFAIANEMRFQVERNGSVDILKGKVLCTIFYEPSTRTSSSFDAAMKRCGGHVVQVTAETSSVQKGEALSDTIRTLACYGDAIVIRHPQVGSAQEAAKYSPVPVINAGDGIGEHPTQALLDVYTIRSELGTVNGRTITLLGDLKNGRTVHSLVSLLCLYSVRLNFVAPTLLAMPSNVVSAARKAGVPVTICESLDEVLADTDVLYVTRVQKERFQSEAEWLLVKDAYRIDHAVLSRAKEDMIVMHPLPRLHGEF